MIIPFPGAAERKNFHLDKVHEGLRVSKPLVLVGRAGIEPATL